MAVSSYILSGRVRMFVPTCIHTPHVSVNSSSQLQACHTINEAIHLEDIKAYLSIPTLQSMTITEYHY